MGLSNDSPAFVLFVEVKICFADIVEEILNDFNNACSLFLAEECEEIANKTECL